MREALLLFLGREGGFEGWIRLRGGAVSARGEGPGLDGLDERAGAPAVVIAPGEQVTLRWVDLPDGLTSAQAAAAARLMGAEWTAQPLPEMHVAVGPAREEGRCVALAPIDRMARWIGEARAAGFEPERILPEPLLLLPPEDGMTAFERAGLRVLRGRTEAFAAEPELAGLLLDGHAVAEIDVERFEAGLGAALDTAPVDLRQGPFARRRELRVEGGRLRRLALLAAALLIASLAVELAAIARYSLAADAAEEEARRIAAASLPRSPGLASRPGALGERLAELRGGGAGFTATAGSVFEAVKATPNLELSAFAFAPDGTLRMTVATASPPAIEALRRRIEASGFTVEAGVPRSGGGRRIADLLVRPR